MLRAKPDLMPETAPSLRKRISVCGHAMRPLAAGALYWEAEDTLLVADLHLEKGAAFAALGMLLPPYDTRTTLQRLEKVIDAVKPGRVVALGDSFHRSSSAASLASEDLAFLIETAEGPRMVLDLRQPRSASAALDRRHDLHHAHHLPRHAAP